MDPKATEKKPEEKKPAEKSPAENVGAEEAPPWAGQRSEEGEFFSALELLFEEEIGERIYFRDVA